MCSSDLSLLRRESSEEDERQKRIVLTAEGKQLRRKAEKVPVTMAGLYLKDLEKARKLKQLCEELYQTLEEAER